MGGINDTLNLIDPNIFIISLEENDKYYIKVKSLKFETQNEIEFPTSFVLEAGTSRSYLDANFYE